MLSARALNRALLARQHLLTRAAMPAGDMVEHLVGMQAQVPGDPYVGLWSRLEGFRPEELSDAIKERGAVRTSLLRGTLHLVTARDAYEIRPALQDVGVRAFASSSFAKDLVGVDVATVVEAGRALLDGEALTTAALGSRLAARWPDRVPSSLAYAVMLHVPSVQLPPRGLWRRSGRPVWRSVEAWLGRRMAEHAEPDRLVLRYLAAFGPASVKDIATWSRLTGVRTVIDRLRPGLNVFRDEQGTELYDVPGGPLVDAETPAPPRLLPEYDNVTLSHADRSRILAPEAYGRVTGYVGTVLVDGFVAGQWRLVRGAGARSGSATVVLEAFVTLRAADREALVEEAHRFLAFAAPEATGHDVVFGIARETAAAAGGTGVEPSPVGRSQWAPRGRATAR